MLGYTGPSRKRTKTLFRYKRADRIMERLRPVLLPILFAEEQRSVLRP